MRSRRRKLNEPDHERFLEGVDVRFRPAAILKRRYETLVVDLGGFDNLSYQERSLVKRFLNIEALVESSEADLIEGRRDRVVISEYLQAVNSLIGLSKILGLKRRQRPVESLTNYINKDQQT